MNQKWSLGNKTTKQVENNLYPNQIAEKILESLKEGASEKDFVVWTQGWSEWKIAQDVQDIVNEINLLKKAIPKEDTPPPLTSLSEPPALPLSAPPTPPAPPTPTASRSPSPTISASISKKSVIQEPVEKKSFPSPVTVNNINNKPKLPRPPESKKVYSPKPAKKEFTKTVEPYPTKRKHPRIVARFRCIIRSTTLTFRTFTTDISLGGVALEDEIPMDLIGVECVIYVASPQINKNLKFKIALTERRVAKYFSFEDADDKIIEELSEWLERHERLAAA